MDSNGGSVLLYSFEERSLQATALSLSAVMGTFILVLLKISGRH